MLQQIVIAALIGVAFVVFAAAVVYSALRLRDEVPDEDREYLDPLPPALRLLWPLLRLVDYHLCQRLPPRLLAGPPAHARGPPGAARGGTRRR